MPRARNLKPGFFKNEDLCELPPLARLLFAALWTLCDREGRLEDRPKRIKAEALPYDECDVNELLWQLHERGFIVRYRVDGALETRDKVASPSNQSSKFFIEIGTFTDHQRPHHNEPNSEIPEYKSFGCINSRQSSKDLLPNSQGLRSSSLNPSSLNPSSPPAAASVEESKTDPEERRLAKEFAPAIHHRHVNRKCSLRQTEDLLTRILSKQRNGMHEATARRIDANHREWCASFDWTKDGGQFCPSLEKWLNVEKERYLIPAVRSIQASTPDPPSPMAIFEAEKQAAIKRGVEY